MDYGIGWGAVGRELETGEEVDVEIKENTIKGDSAIVY